MTCLGFFISLTSGQVNFVTCPRRLMMTSPVQFCISIPSRVMLDSDFSDWFDSDSCDNQVIQLWLNSTFYFSWLTQLRLNSNPRFCNLTQLWLNSFESELNQIWFTTHHILPNLTKVVDRGTYPADSSSTYPVDSTLTQMTISVIRLWLDSFESESSQIWLTYHESSTTLLDRSNNRSNDDVIRWK